MAALGGGKVWAAMGQPGRPSACQDRGATPKKASCRRISIVITFMWLHIVSIGCVSVPDVLLSAFQDWFLPCSLQLSELGTRIVPFSKQELRFKQSPVSRSLGRSVIEVGFDPMLLLPDPDSLSIIQTHILSCDLKPTTRVSWGLSSLRSEGGYVWRGSLPVF